MKNDSFEAIRSMHPGDMYLLPRNTEFWVPRQGSMFLSPYDLYDLQCVVLSDAINVKSGIFDEMFIHVFVSNVGCYFIDHIDASSAELILKAPKSSVK